MLRAEVITIGDEILIGQIADSNATWITGALDAAGIPVRHLHTIADDPGELEDALDLSLSRAEIIIMTGGLGPTPDDHTKAVLCSYFGSRPVLHEESLKDVELLFARRGLPLTEVNRQQAELPECCQPIRNLNGTAPGMWFEKDGKVIVSLPGVPYEMKAMMTDHVIPALLQKFNVPGRIHRTVLTQGVGESFLTEIIREWENNLPEGMKLAYLPSPGLVRLRLTAEGENKEELRKITDLEIRKLYALIPDLIFGEGDDTLEAVLGRLLKENGKRLSVAESCTGGYLAHRITSVPGSSAYFSGSVTAYANEVKARELGVEKALIETHGAVSRSVACAMAEGIRKRLNTDYSVATTGVAGPDGGTPEKPVGTVWIAVSSAAGTEAHHFLMGEHRERNIVKSALTAMNLLRKKILSENPAR